MTPQLRGHFIARNREQKNKKPRERGFLFFIPRTILQGKM
jgi:hypothetical protein